MSVKKTTHPGEQSGGRMMEKKGGRVEWTRNGSMFWTWQEAINHPPNTHSASWVISAHYPSPPKPRTDDAKTTQAHRAYGPIRHKPTVYWLHSWLGGYYSLLSVQCCGSGPFIDRIHLFKTFGYRSRFRRLLCIITNVWIQVHWWCENLSFNFKWKSKCEPKWLRG